ncbi:putative transcription regulator GNAT family [Helianthus annuus]|uniref:uncharacterized protein LOC110904664 isoform X2 n=1 Tax=Helianthus annuus TaxID=4232 RepID=UPI000B8F024B|nr:uncharacterized protein LOC110904664 isoform X2 [Helianthus annuus]KAJ0465575.1 putative transcription regulator GNAT family [Helianthus annuus]KAJ0470430.1 putative transcription regulator GNAT family [Helianthus annuus]KAJ0487168.1 putative transcription regulator GNAT family [Helianthus annuus]KAJ0661287.1 putative transcription regulator GNAT family [Helianthus annuus]KAJ0855444.1 putative transcription regulator GNAT family [Helianthus annuus]
MWTIPLGISISPNFNKLPLFSPSSRFPQSSLSHHISRSSDTTGICKASQAVEIFPIVSPEIVVREARIEDCWEVAETHLPNGCRRTCLVAVTGASEDDTFCIGDEDLKIAGFGAKISLNKGYVAGILTLDTVADFLPRKGPLRQRRTGIAYVSNVAVRERFRRKGIAKKLIAKAEAQAISWGCRSIALHCDLNNPGATNLYRSQGFRDIKVPEGAKWPQPRTSPDMQFNFMMKLLHKNRTS